MHGQIDFVDLPVTHQDLEGICSLPSRGWVQWHPPESVRRTAPQTWTACSPCRCLRGFQLSEDVDQYHAGEHRCSTLLRNNLNDGQAWRAALCCEDVLPEAIIRILSSQWAIVRSCYVGESGRLEKSWEYVISTVGPFHKSLQGVSRFHNSASQTSWPARVSSRLPASS